MLRASARELAPAEDAALVRHDERRARARRDREQAPRAAHARDRHAARRVDEARRRADAALAAVVRAPREEHHLVGRGRARVAAVEAAGFEITRTEMTGTNFYFSRLLEATKKA